MVHPGYQYTPKLITALGSMISSGVYDVALGSPGRPFEEVGVEPQPQLESEAIFETENA